MTELEGMDLPAQVGQFLWSAWRNGHVIYDDEERLLRRFWHWLNDRKACVDRATFSATLSGHNQAKFPCLVRSQTNVGQPIWVWDHREAEALWGPPGLDVPKIDPDDRGPGIQVASGRIFYPYDPRPEDIDLHDIVWALSHENRWGGHTIIPYSVLSHSLAVAETLRQEGYSCLVQMAGLAHDFAEAYLRDIPRPIKEHPSFDTYREKESQLQVAIEEALGLPDCGSGAWGLVKDADEFRLLSEAHVLLRGGPRGWGEGREYDATPIAYTTPAETRRVFFSKYRSLVDQIYRTSGFLIVPYADREGKEELERGAASEDKGRVLLGYAVKDGRGNWLREPSPKEDPSWWGPKALRHLFDRKGAEARCLRSLGQTIVAVYRVRRGAKTEKP